MRSGRVYSTPVNLHELGGKQYLVAPRGRTQWVKNAEISGEIVLKKRSERQRFRLRPLSDPEKPAILKSYLARYRSAVQRFFPVRPDARIEEFTKISPGYPVFELIPN